MACKPGHDSFTPVSDRPGFNPLEHSAMALGAEAGAMLMNKGMVAKVFGIEPPTAAGRSQPESLVMTPIAVPGYNGYQSHSAA